MEPQFKEGDKLYILTRRDMSPGQQLAQAIHVKDTFSFEHPETNRAWYEQSNFICCLSVENEEELAAFVETAGICKIECSSFWELDRNGELTAIALAPGETTREICKPLPLALR